MGWASYLIGSFSANVKHYVGVDVIPHVVDKCQKIFEENANNPFDSDIMKFDFYCCPSEPPSFPLAFTSPDNAELS